MFNFQAFTLDKSYSRQGYNTIIMGEEGNYYDLDGFFNSELIEINKETVNKFYPELIVKVTNRGTRNELKL